MLVSNVLSLVSIPLHANLLPDIKRPRVVSPTDMKENSNSWCHTDLYAEPRSLHTVLGEVDTVIVLFPLSHNQPLTKSTPAPRSHSEVCWNPYLESHGHLPWSAPTPPDTQVMEKDVGRARISLYFNCPSSILNQTVVRTESSHHCAGHSDD